MQELFTVIGQQTVAIAQLRAEIERLQTENLSLKRALQKDGNVAAPASIGADFGPDSSRNRGDAKVRE